jgi:hypothetical protein
MTVHPLYELPQAIWFSRREILKHWLVFVGIMGTMIGLGVLWLVR